MVRKVNVSEIEARDDTKWPAGTLILDGDLKLRVFDGLSSTGTWPIDMYTDQNVANFLSNMGSNSITTSGTVTIDGIYSNIVRKARYIGLPDVWISLDNLIATVGDTPKKLKVKTVTDNLTVTGSTATTTASGVSVNIWDAVLLEPNNYTQMSGALDNNGDTAVLTITSNGGDSIYRVTAMRVDGVANVYSTVIERIG